MIATLDIRSGGDRTGAHFICSPGCHSLFVLCHREFSVVVCKIFVDYDTVKGRDGVVSLPIAGCPNRVADSLHSRRPPYLPLT